MVTNCVIGTGPAGISAAKALIDAGQRVLLIDPGVTIESDKLSVKDRLQSTEPSKWSAGDLEQFKSNLVPSTKGVGQKNVYGSDYVFRMTPQARKMRVSNSKVTRSFAAGGLSNVWGACFLPYTSAEMREWPSEAKDLTKYYSAVASFVPITSAKDSLAAELSRFGDPSNVLTLSRQADEFLSDMKISGSELGKRGLSFGASRLALNAKDCRYCSLCLYGCPYDLIYSSRFTLSSLPKDKVDYRSDLYVAQIEQDPAGVTVRAVNTKTGSIEKLKFNKVFLAAGVLETARIMLESLNARGHELKAKHSDRFTLPFLRYKGVKDIYEEQLNTLSQLFIELSNSDVSNNSVHLQVYTYNDLYRRVFDNKLGPLSKLFSFPIKKFLERLLVFFGYLHSDESSTFSIVLEPGEDGELVVVGKPNPIAKKVVSKVRKTLFSMRGSLRGIPTLASLDLPGGGNHSGATFPMRERPGQFESDILGRPYGFSNLHIVDSSVFSSLPSTTITYTSMANAYRIATQSYS